MDYKTAAKEELLQILQRNGVPNETITKLQELVDRHVQEGVDKFTQYYAATEAIKPYLTSYNAGDWETVQLCSSQRPKKKPRKRRGTETEVRDAQAPTVTAPTEVVSQEPKTIHGTDNFDLRLGYSAKTTGNS